MRKGRLLLTISAVVLVPILAVVLFLGRLDGPGRKAPLWLTEQTFRSGPKAVHSSAAKALVGMDPRAALETFIAVELSELQGTSFGSRHGYLEFQHVPLFLVADLAAMLDEPDPYRATVAAYGIEMLCKMHPGYSFAEAVPGLTRILASPDHDCSVAAAHAIAALGDRAPRAKRLLIECFRSGAITKSRLLVGMQLTKAEVLELSGGLSH